MPKKNQYNCPAELTCKLIGGKWKSAILFYLRKKPIRFGELQRMLSGIPRSTLARELRELEGTGLIVRIKIGTESYEGVEYSLTEIGKSLRSILKSLIQWGLDNQRQYINGKFNILEK